MKQEMDNLNEFEQPFKIYGSFKDRCSASLIDGFILLPLVAIDWFDKGKWKSQLILFMVFIVGVTYKSFCEFKYGATLGKMAMKLKVVNYQLLKVDLQAVLVRNIFDISERIFYFAVSLIIFRSIEYQNIHSMLEFNILQAKMINVNYFMIFTLILTGIEIIFLLMDKRKRSLHDRMAGTFVIKLQNIVPA